MPAEPLLPPERVIYEWLAENWPGGVPKADLRSAVAAMYCDLYRFVDEERSRVEKSALPSVTDANRDLFVWLGVHRNKLPPEAVGELQEIADRIGRKEAPASSGGTGDVLVSAHREAAALELALDTRGLKELRDRARNVAFLLNVAMGREPNAAPIAGQPGELRQTSEGRTQIRTANGWENIETAPTPPKLLAAQPAAGGGGEARAALASYHATILADAETKRRFSPEQIERAREALAAQRGGEGDDAVAALEFIASTYERRNDLPDDDAVAEARALIECVERAQAALAGRQATSTKAGAVVTTDPFFGVKVEVDTVTPIPDVPRRMRFYLGPAGAPASSARELTSERVVHLVAEITGHADHLSTGKDHHYTVGLLRRAGAMLSELLLAVLKAKPSAQVAEALQDATHDELMELRGSMNEAGEWHYPADIHRDAKLVNEVLAARRGGT